MSNMPTTTEKSVSSDILCDMYVMQYNYLIDNKTSNEASFAVDVKPLNPTETATFNRVPEIAKNFQTYHCNGLIITYIPQCKIDQEGQWCVAVATDPQYPDPTCFDDLSTLAGNVVGPVNKECTFRIDARLFNKSPVEKQVHALDDLDPENDNPLWSFGRLFIGTHGNTSNAVIKTGVVKITYDFVFNRPKLEDGTVGTMQTLSWDAAGTEEFLDSHAVDKMTGPQLFCVDSNHNRGATLGTGFFCRDRNYGHNVIMIGTKPTVAWDPADLGVATSIQGGAGALDLIDHVPYRSTQVTNGESFLLYHIPRNTRYVMFYATSTVTDIKVLICRSMQSPDL